MKTLKTFLCILLLAAFALATTEENVTGKWSGSFAPVGSNGETKESTAFLVLKQTGTEITGTAGPNEGEQYPIEKGKIEGNKITLEVNHDDHILKFALVVADERIKGEASMAADGQEMKAKLDVGRVK